jgi:hypothetical protein
LKWGVPDGRSGGQEGVNQDFDIVANTFWLIYWILGLFSYKGGKRVDYV